MSRSVAHYVRRGQELGLLGTLKRAWRRSRDGVQLWSQSVWWGWAARRKMSDADLLARTSGDWRSLDELLDHFANRPPLTFMLPHESSQETSSVLNHFYPEHSSAVLAAADAVCRNELVLLGQVFSFPDGIDWQRDPISGWRWPLLYRSRLDTYLGSERPVDLIRFWEMNRHQHFAVLGLAYWLSGEQKYLDAFTNQIHRWIDTNPLQHGVNWYYPLEISIRLIAWTVAFQFFRSSPEFRQKTGSAFLKSLWQQADFLSGHLQVIRSRGDVPNNHMMAELTGLVLVGTIFPEFRLASSWRTIGLDLLKEQTPAQTHPDGVNKEQATGYHRFVAELLLLIVAHSHRGDIPNEPVLDHTLEQMLDYVFFSLMPNGTAPQWGDSDYGRALGLGQHKDFWDFRPLLSAGSVLFDRPDWKYAAGRFDEEAFWLLGLNGLDRWNRLEPRLTKETSRAFTYAGIYVIRDEWSSDTDVAMVRCGPFGLGGEKHCAHAHCDLLSLILWVNGYPLLVDSGTYFYSGQWRDQFRLTPAHNTVRVDAHEQAVPMPLFNWQQIPEANCLQWTGTRVTGALYFPDQVKWVRMLDHPRPGLWELIDTFTGHAEHRLEWFFHYAPGLDLQIQEGKHMLTVLKEGSPFLIVHLPDNGFRYQLRDSWYSYQYGVKQSNLELYAQWQGKLEDKGISFHWQFQLVNERV